MMENEIRYKEDDIGQCLTPCPFDNRVWFSRIMVGSSICVGECPYFHCNNDYEQIIYCTCTEPFNGDLINHIV